MGSVAGDQEPALAQSFAHLGAVVGVGCAHDCTDRRPAAVAERVLAPGVDHRREVLPDGSSVGSHELFDGRVRLEGGFCHHEDAVAVGERFLDEVGDAVVPDVAVDGQPIHLQGTCVLRDLSVLVEVIDPAEVPGRVGLADCVAAIAALGVEDHDQSELVGEFDGLRHGLQARTAVDLPERCLELHAAHVGCDRAEVLDGEVQEELCHLLVLVEHLLLGEVRPQVRRHVPHLGINPAAEDAPLGGDCRRETICEVLLLLTGIARHGSVLLACCLSRVTPMLVRESCIVFVIR